MNVCNIALFLLLLSLSESTHFCRQGTFTGMLNPTAEKTIAKYKPQLDMVEENASISLTDLTERIAFLKVMLQDHIENARKVSLDEIQDFKHLTKAAKEEAKKSSPAVTMCITKQELEATKLSTTPNKSEKNTTILYDIKKKMLKIKEVASKIASNCRSLYPLNSQSQQLENCLKAKIEDTNSSIREVNSEFDCAMKILLDKSFKCNMVYTNGIFKKIGELTNAVRNCRYADYD